MVRNNNLTEMIGKLFKLWLKLIVKPFLGDLAAIGRPHKIGLQPVGKTVNKQS